MNNNPFKKEVSYGLIFFVLAFVCGTLTGFWSWSFLLWALVYILWKWVELFFFYRWYSNGADKKKKPLSHGIWERLCTLVIFDKNQNRKVEKKNKYLLNQFDIMAHAMPYATVLLNKRFEIVWANQTSAKILNISQDKNKGHKIEDIIRESNFIKILSNDLKTSEVNILHPSDSNKRILIKLVRLTNKRYLLVARDISQQDTLRKSRKAFVDNASHELRTPLTVITGYLEMMRNAEDIPNTWHEAISQTQQQSQRMEKIINDMLDLSSIEHEYYMQNYDVTVNMPKLLNRLLNGVKSLSEARKHHITANIDSSLMVKGNEDEITSICLNLLNNAIIHTRVGTNISLQWFVRNNSAQLWVSDNGEGIESKHLLHLTERFYRVDNSRNKNKSSTGLGLAIVKQICENHEAKLTIESKIGEGTCFKVVFASFENVV